MINFENALENENTYDSHITIKLYISLKRKFSETQLTNSLKCNKVQNKYLVKVYVRQNLRVTNDR